MSIYKESIKYTARLTGLSFIVALALFISDAEMFSFALNICYGIFGSSLLTLITSVIGYNVVRKETLEQFYLSVSKFINVVNHYQLDMNLDEKINFVLYISEYDFTDITMTLGKIDFLKHEEYYDYIDKQIYQSIFNIKNVAQEHSWKLRLHKNGIDRNEAVISGYVDKFEKLIIEKKKDTVRYNDEDIQLGGTIRNIVYEDIKRELNGKYYDIMKNKKENAKDGKNEDADRKPSR